MTSENKADKVKGVHIASNFPLLKSRTNSHNKHQTNVCNFDATTLQFATIAASEHCLECSEDFLRNSLESWHLEWNKVSSEDCMVTV